jgi:hypothetical protein
MARFWKEQLDPERHRDYMASMWIGGISVLPPRDPLIVQWVYFVDVCSFTFQFHSLQQLQTCLSYFSQKNHASTRVSHNGLEHYWQQWYERLPQWLFEEAKRQRIVKALTRALTVFQAESDDPAGRLK